MMPKNDRSLQAKETALLALAQGDPEFPAFLDRYGRRCLRWRSSRRSWWRS